MTTSITPSAHPEDMSHRDRRHRLHLPCGPRHRLRRKSVRLLPSRTTSQAATPGTLPLPARRVVGPLASATKAAGFTDFPRDRTGLAGTFPNDKTGI